MNHGEREALYGALAEWRRRCWERYVGPAAGVYVGPQSLAQERTIDLAGFAAYRKCAAAHEKLF